MIMHPRMPEIAEIGWAQTHYKCENQHNFTKDGELVDVFGNPLKKKPVVKKDKTEGNLSYSIKEEAITITKCNSSASGELSIPATIEGKSVTSIGERAFSKCHKLTSITIPDSVTSIGDGAFKSGSNLTTIEVGAGNPDYTDMDGVLFNKEKTALRIYPAGKTGDNYTIPDGVTRIEYRTFYGCTSLTSITIPDSVTSIGKWAFRECTGLTSITIPDGVTSIGVAAFYGCERLTSLTIGNSVTSIGNKAFSSCRKLTAVTFLGDAPKAGEQVFEFTISTIYRNPEAKGWGDTWGGRPVKLISEKP
ncbi:leucine-rich repeat domain-containing protein, partial [Verrucomicrobia bacterium]|nr:leucine-rich repeat domain-containing protein [Verrucomicrobiota bacterium]